MNAFDAGVLSIVNRLAHRWYVLDATVALIATNTLIKGGIVSAMIWWGWFRNGLADHSGEERREHRAYLSWGIVAGFLALLVARTLAELLPYRERPMHTPELHFQLPYVSNEAMMIHWSSFPSDHAALFFALALAIYFVSRRMGIVALCYTAVLICAPRVYMGYHYPTDIVAGAAIGLGAAWLGKVGAVREAVARVVLRWMDQSPGYFYAGFFLLTFQIAITFDSLRHIARYATQVARAMVQGTP